MPFPLGLHDIYTDRDHHLLVVLTGTTTGPAAASVMALGTDPRFARNKDRIANREALRAELAAVFSQHEAEPLCNRLLAAGLPAGPVVLPPVT